MIPIRRFTLLEAVLLIVIVAGAAGARYWYLAACCAKGMTDGPILVQDEPRDERDALVRSLKEGAFKAKAPLAAGEEATAHQGIGYPWLVSLLYRFTDEIDVVYQRVRWIQWALGALTAGLYFLFARRAFRNLAAATLAGMFCAIYPFWIANTAEVADGVLATFLLALCLFLGVRAGQTGGALTSLIYGAGLAALALVRAALFPFAVIAVLWLLWRSRRLAGGWLYALLALIGFIGVLVPWTHYAYRTLGEVVPVADAGFYHLWIGNNPRATGGPLSDEDVRQALADSPDGQGKADRLSQMKQPARYRELGKDAWEEMRARPAETFQRRLHAAVAFCLGDIWFRDGSLFRKDPVNEEGLPAWVMPNVPVALAGSLFFLFLGGFIGWRWSHAWRYEAMPSSLAPFWIALPYVLTHADRLSGPRLPLDGLLLCYVAFVLVGLIPGAGTMLFRRVQVED